MCGQIQAALGEGTRVVLDLFHAIQRVTRLIPKRHRLSQKAAHDLACCFRHPADKGKSKRTLPTPEADAMECNLHLFLKKYSDITDDKSQPILTDIAKTAIDKLLVHVRKGCLSAIPVGANTSANENLHKHLRASGVNVPRLTPYLAVARLYLFAAQWNSRIAGKEQQVRKKMKTNCANTFTQVRINKIRQRLKKTKQDTTEVPVEHFGIGLDQLRTLSSDDLCGWQRMTQDELGDVLSRADVSDHAGDSTDEKLHFLLSKALSYYKAMSLKSNMTVASTMSCELVKDTFISLLKGSSSPPDNSILLHENLSERNLSQLDYSPVHCASSHMVQQFLPAFLACVSQPEQYVEVTKHMHQLGFTMVPKDTNDFSLLCELLAKEIRDHTDVYACYLDAEIPQALLQPDCIEGLLAHMEHILPLAVASSPVFIAFHAHSYGLYSPVTCVLESTNSTQQDKPKPSLTSCGTQYNTCVCGKGNNTLRNSFSLVTY